jgi:hypothetical protein
METCLFVDSDFWVGVNNEHKWVGSHNNVTKNGWNSESGMTDNNQMQVKENLEFVEDNFIRVLAK